MTADVGEPDSPGPDRGKRGVMRREPLTRNTGEDSASHKPVHGTTTDSLTGKNETRSGAVFAAPCHRFGMDEEAYRLTRKDGAPGIDGVVAADYATNLEANLLDL